MFFFGKNKYDYAYDPNEVKIWFVNKKKEKESLVLK